MSDTNLAVPVDKKTILRELDDLFFSDSDESKFYRKALIRIRSQIREGRLDVESNSYAEGYLRGRRENK